jgi:hypothetical protein
MKYNIIYTNEEYMAQGFTAQEVPMIRRHDIIFNKDVDGEATEEEMAELVAIQRALGL